MVDKNKLYASTTKRIASSLSGNSKSFASTALSDRQVAAALLSEALNNPARLGVNTKRFGLVTTAYSDHLPIQFNFDDKQVMSWNMLADVHLYNSLMNVTGFALLNENTKEGDPYHKKIHFFLSDLSTFLLKNKDSNGVINITRDLLEKFVKDDAKREDGRKLLIDHMTDASHPNHHEYKLMIEHACQLVDHIEGPLKPLKWESRVKEMRNDKKLMSNFAEKDFVCLQECTNPQDVLGMIDAFTDKQHSMLVHKANPKSNSNDHCVIIYDPNKYEVVQAEMFAVNNNTKPCIAARLRDKKDGSELIVASIHHPGGSHSEIANIMQQVNKVQPKDAPPVPFFIAGDYNNTKAGVENMVRKGNMDKQGVHYATPGRGTMAGPDFGNTNQAIDGVLSSRANIQVNVIPQAVARPVESSVKVKIDLAQSLQKKQEQAGNENDSLPSNRP